jgi:hypothetical protein
MKNRICRTHGTRLNLENARRGEGSSDDTREREKLDSDQERRMRGQEQGVRAVQACK